MVTWLKYSNDRRKYRNWLGLRQLIHELTINRVRRWIEDLVFGHFLFPYIIQWKWKPWNPRRSSLFKSKHLIFYSELPLFHPIQHKYLIYGGGSGMNFYHGMWIQGSYVHMFDASGYASLFFNVFIQLFFFWSNFNYFRYRAWISSF